MKKRFIRSLALLLTLSMLAGLCCIGAAAYDYTYPNNYTNTGNQAVDIVEVAKTQIGYRESPDDHTKYNEWYYGDDHELAWCSIFISWCAEQANISTATIARTNAARGWTTSDMSTNPFGAPAYAFGTVTPQPGDILFTITQTGATASTHTGLVSEVDSTTIYTIEGNTVVGGVGSVGSRHYRLDTGYQYYSNYDKPNGTTHILFIVRPEYHTHSYQFDHKAAPTCMESGYNVYTCTYCSDSYQEKTGSTVGHSFTSYMYNDDAGICVNGTETAVCDYGCGTTNTRTKAGTAQRDPNEKNPFLDVPPGKYYYDPVIWGAENGIVYGTSADTFNPAGTCTRAQVVTFLYRLAGMPEVSGENPFKDVSSKEYYYDAVLWGYQNGIVYGTDTDAFSPNDKVTRDQFVTFLYRYAGTPAVSGSNSFTDVKQGTYYYDAVLWGYQNQIVYGTSTYNFSPKDSCSREQVVTFIYRYAVNYKQGDWKHE